MLRDSGLNFTTADAMDEAAREVVAVGTMTGETHLAQHLALALRICLYSIDRSTRLMVQGLTGREGTFHAKQAAAYGTSVVGGMTPGKGGTTHEGWPVFNTDGGRGPRDGRERVASIFVPPPVAADAMMEAADAGVALVVCITEGIPTLDMMRAITFMKGKPTRLDRAELPGRHFAGQGEGGHHSRSHLQEGTRRHRLAERDAHLRSHSAADASWASARRPASASAAIR